MLRILNLRTFGKSVFIFDIINEHAYAFCIVRMSVDFACCLEVLDISVVSL